MQRVEPGSRRSLEPVDNRLQRVRDELVVEPCQQLVPFAHPVMLAWMSRVASRW